MGSSGVTFVWVLLVTDVWDALCFDVSRGAEAVWTGSLGESGRADDEGYGRLALSSANVAGGTKKAISTGAIFIGYNVGK